MASISIDDIRKQKQQLRREVRSRLQSLTQDVIKVQSQQVWDRLFEIPAYQQAKSVGLFLSMPSGEINTDPVIQHAVENGKQIYVPQVGKNFERSDMELLKVITEGTSSGDGGLFHHTWPRNKWGIPEPPSDMAVQKASPGDIDLLVVPGLAFDRRGDRLGQGKGYYDRFIERMISAATQSPTLVAVGLDCQLVESIPVHEHDRPMDLILLPSEKIQPACSS